MDSVNVAVCWCGVMTVSKGADKCTYLQVTQVRNMSSTAHVGIHTFNVDDPDWTSMVVWETTTPHLYANTNPHEVFLKSVILK